MAIIRLEGLGQLKIPMASSGIDPAIFRLLADSLNQLRYRVLEVEKSPVLAWNQTRFLRCSDNNLLATPTETSRLPNKVEQ
jgi:hypothetical protein